MFMNQDDRTTGECPRCGLAWQSSGMGESRRCAFEGEAFDARNWACGWAGLIRDRMNARDGDTSLSFRDDAVGSYGATVVTFPREQNTGEGPDVNAGMLVATWSKNRGATDEIRWAYPPFDAEDDGESTVFTTAQMAAIAAEFAREAERERRGLRP